MNRETQVALSTGGISSYMVIHALKPGDKVTHKVLGEGTILDYDEERDSFKIDFNGSIRFIRASFLTK